MGHMTEVLRLCLVDMVFFSVIFAVSIVSFSNMLYVQLGSVVPSCEHRTALQPAPQGAHRPLRCTPPPKRGTASGLARAFYQAHWLLYC